MKSRVSIRWRFGLAAHTRSRWLSLGLGSAGLMAALAVWLLPAAEANSPRQRPRQTVRASRDKCRQGVICRAFGTPVPSKTLGTRVFATNRVGFALATTANGVTYPAGTVDAGKVWRIIGPPLHIPAANGPAAVTSVGAVKPGFYFAYAGPEGGNAIDVTADGGTHWWQAFLGDAVPAVVSDVNGRLTAFAQAGTGASPTKRVATWVYYSTDGGRVWRYTKAYVH